MPSLTDMVERRSSTTTMEEFSTISLVSCLMMLAPIVMGVIGRQKRQQKLDSGQLGTVLQQERTQIEQRSPGAGGLLGGLDRDQPSAIGHQPSAIGHQPSAIGHQPSAINA